MTWFLDAKKAGINLPEGYKLEEDEDFVYLKKGKTVVATFPSKGPSPKEIEKEAWNVFKK